MLFAPRKTKDKKLLELESREKLLRIQHLRIAAEHEEELEKQRSQLEQEKVNIQLDTDLEILKAQLNVSSENLALLDQGSKCIPPSTSVSEFNALPRAEKNADSWYFADHSKSSKYPIFLRCISTDCD